MNTLIIGGTSGLGLELAKRIRDSGNEVYVTGRSGVEKADLNFKNLDLSAPDLPHRVNGLVSKLPQIDSLIYTAGYFQEGRVTDLSEEQIEEMISVGGRGLIYTVQAILSKQDSLSELITVTSTSQWTPRKLEPIYNFVKAGGAHFSSAVAEDGRISKVLVAGPAGMKTEFWDGVEKDFSRLLDPGWVADEILKLRDGDYNYRFAKILREPARTEIIETR